MPKVLKDSTVYKAKLKFQEEWGRGGGGGLNQKIFSLRGVGTF